MLKDGYTLLAVRWSGISYVESFNLLGNYKHRHSPIVTLPPQTVDPINRCKIPYGLGTYPLRYIYVIGVKFDDRFLQFQAFRAAIVCTDRR